MQNTDFAPLDVRLVINCLVIRFCPIFSDSQLSTDPFARGSVGVFKPGFDIELLEFLKGHYTNNQVKINNNH